MADFFRERMLVPEFLPGIPREEQVRVLATGVISAGSADTFTPTGKGSNRLLLVFFADCGGSPPVLISSISFGGVAMKIVHHLGGNNFAKENHGVAYLLDHEIPAGANSITQTGGNTGQNEEVHVIELANVSQSQPLAGANYYYNSAGNPINAGVHLKTERNANISIIDPTVPHASVLYGYRGQFYLAAGAHTEAAASDLDRPNCVRGFNEYFYSNDYDGFSDTAIQGGPIVKDGPLDSVTWSYVSNANQAVAQAVLVNPINWKGPRGSRTRRFALADPLPQTRVLNVPQVTPWTTMPPPGTPLDENNYFAKHAMVGMVANQPAPIDFVAGRQVNAVQSDWEFRTNDKGFSSLHFGGSGTGDRWRVDDSSVFDTFNDAPGYTLVCVIKTDILRPGNTEAFAGFIQMHGSVTGVHVLKANASDALVFYFGLTGINLPDYIREEWMTLICSFNYTTSTNGTAYMYCYDIHGNLFSSVEGSDRIADVTTMDRFVLADRLGQEGDCEIALGAALNVGLTPSQIQELGQNPWQIFQPQDLQVPIEYEELTFDETKEERLYIIPQGATRQPR